jgi:hypothetical protein
MVSSTWNKSPEECFTDFKGGPPLKLSQESRDIVINSSLKQKQSNKTVALEILHKRNKRVSVSTVMRYRKREELKPFHVISKPMKTQTNIEDRLWLCNQLIDWTETDFLHLCPSDEFFVYSIRKPNHQNDRIYAKRIEDISVDERYRELVRNPTCIGIFLMFSAKKLTWVLKERGESWDGTYFRETILKEHVIPFLSNPENVISVDDAIFLHDKAPCMKANATQQLLSENNITFWGNTVWPGNSPDFNAAENVGSIVKDEVEKLMLSERVPDKHSRETLKRNIETVLQSLENNSEIFESLLCSYPERRDAILKANGGNTDY